MKSLLETIEERRSGFSKGQRKLADYLKSNYEQAAFMTAYALGEAVGVSESTVVRFAAGLGFSGYPDFKAALRQLVMSSITTVQRAKMAAAIPREDVVDAVLSVDIASIENTKKLVDRDAFSAAADLILNARRVYVLGLRAAMPLAQFLAYYLDFIRGDVLFVNGAVRDVKDGLSRLEAEDLVIGVSFPRYDMRTIRAMGYAKAQGAAVVAITDGDNSPAAANASLALFAKTEMISFADSLCAPMSLINALLVAVGLSRRDETREHLEHLERIWDEEGVFVKEAEGCV
ncbi:MAG: MurR/RpiR family transcriptional regulator [Clostridia bacterium]|nr:MurR/RpiR family transcriptional regulator [Clostridia bacterium]